MQAIRWLAAALSFAACPAGAQSYTWTDITPAFDGVSDRFHVQVERVGVHVLDGKRLVITGGFWPQSQLGTLSYSVMYSEDGGKSWNIPATPLTQYIPWMFVDIARPGTVYLETRGSPSIVTGPAPASLLRSDDFGRSWSIAYTMALGDTYHPFAIDPLASDGLYGFYQQLYVNWFYPGGAVEARNPGITGTHDAGRTWSVPFAAPSVTSILAESASYYLAGPTPTAPQRLFVGSFEDGTSMSTDRGATWSRIDAKLQSELPMSPSPLRWIRPDPRQTNVLYGHIHSELNERIARSDDGGTTWRQIFGTALAWPDMVIDPAHPNVLWVPQTNALYRSENRGDSFSVIALPAQTPSGYFPLVVTADAGAIYLASYGRLYRGVPALAPDPVVVEFGYEGNRYWLTSLDGEAVSQDYRQQPGDVKRTGLQWAAWRADDAPSGAVGSCRFWSRPESGLRTRVLVQQGFECESLKRNPDWMLEAENEFYTLPPANGTCPANGIPVTRFNNLQADLNHRWVSDRDAAAEMRSRGWYDEGVRFCARPLGNNE